MDNIMFPVEFMKIGYALTVPLLFVFLLISFVRNQLIKCTLYFVKAAAYFGLAFFMWKFYCNKEQIDVVSAFTFIFCCFECADNIVSLLSIPINYIHDCRDRKFEYKMKQMELESKRKI